MNIYVLVTGSITLTRICHYCSNINADLSRVNIVPSQSCICGHNYENEEHYFLNCWLYDIQRQQLLQKLNFIPVITTDLLLYGSTQVIVLK